MDITDKVTIKIQGNPNEYTGYANSRRSVLCDKRIEGLYGEEIVQGCFEYSYSVISDYITDIEEYVSTFEIGEIVIGNKIAGIYGVTHTGVKCVVTGFEGAKITVQTLEGPDTGTNFPVFAFCFDSVRKPVSLLSLFEESNKGG